MTKKEFKRIRLTNKLSQKDFGELLGITPRMVQYKESEYCVARSITLRDRKMIEQLKKNKKLK